MFAKESAVRIDDEIDGQPNCSNEDRLDKSPKSSLQRSLAKACSRFETCSASLCPLRQNEGIWFADEAICTNNIKAKGCPWVKKQRRIAKINMTAGGVPGYFDQNLLESIKIVRPGIAGVDPDAGHRIRRYRRRRPDPERHSDTDSGVECLRMEHHRPTGKVMEPTDDEDAAGKPSQGQHKGQAA
jgi:hypothetical protein